MSHTGKPISGLGLDKVTDRFRESVTCDDTNKPDFRELDLGSPISPLRVRSNGPAVSSSSSSSSGSMSGRNGFNPVQKRPDSGGNSHSGELSGSVESSPTFSPGGSRGFKPGHRRSDSGSFSVGSGTVNSPAVNVLPTGNICPSGKILKTGMACRSSKTDVLGSGTGNYGHGSIMRGGGATKSGGDAAANSPVRKVMSGVNPEELKRAGNEHYKRGQFEEALGYYDRAIAASPGNATCHCNRAAALIGLKRLSEAVRECEEAVRLDPGYVRARHRLGSLLLSLGQIENARRHLCFPGHQPDPMEMQKLQAVEIHLNKCTIARKNDDWTCALSECDSAIASGANASPQLFACRAEALLKLQRLNDADLSLSNVPEFGTSSHFCSQTKFFGMLSEAYLVFVRAQICMALGRFEAAITSAEKAVQIDARNIEVSLLLNKVRSVARARDRGNSLFKSEKFSEACAAYGEGLRFDSSNSVLYCNRAACWSSLGQWEQSLADCNKALGIQPNYTKALLRRATSNSKLHRWADAVRDYEVLKKQHPHDTGIAESLFHAQVDLMKSRKEDVSNMKFGGEVELVSGLEQFRAAISSPGASVVLFKTESNPQCKQISPFLDTLCSQYPSINFLKVDVEESPGIADAERVNNVPTIKIYKKGNRVKEMVCPSPKVLESSVQHYS
ncbi:hypothetical protein RJ640_004363 [Escallonia rubra]|uniref:Thioredoxin domain-containing protein n=1 Tax=Escallonia rubra TaxID=112253 RepID=A0AA88RHK3_9ASTE|nr:hypothetical protein RJ640_004363 [Escallonia rubra]